MSYTIGSCAANIPFKFGDRFELGNQADGSKPIVAIQQSIAELSETYELEELKVQTPVPPATTLALSVAQPVVPIASLLATIQGNTNYPQFQNQNFVDITDVYSFWMWFTGGVNQAGRLLKYRRVPTVDEDSYGITSSQQGSIGVAPPVYYTRFGSVLQVAPAPDNPYQFFVRMKLRHPYPVLGTFTPAILTPIVNASGQITGVTIVSPGIGYQPNIALSGGIPLVFSLPISGVLATGTAGTSAQGQISGTQITTNGSGYVSGNATVATGAMAQQIVFAPDSWQEIIEYAACLRLATWEGASEYIAMFDNILKSKGVDVAKAREVKSQMRRDETHNERSLSLRLGSPYTFAR